MDKEAEEVEALVRIFGEFGVLAALLVLLLIGLAIALRWGAQNVLLPMSSATIQYLNHQTDCTAKNMQSIEDLTRLETDIRDAIVEMRESHSDSDSKFATVHTNVSLSLLAKAIGRVAKALNVDVEDLVDEIERTLRNQRS